MAERAAAADSGQVFLDALRRIVQALRVADRVAERRAGLSGAQLFVLRCLARSDAPLDLRTLAHRTRTHHSSVSVVVQRLVARGLVTRERAADDARRVALRLSAAGRRALRGVPALPQEVLVAYVDRLAPSTRRRLAAAMAHLAAAVAPDDEPAPMLFEAPVRPRRRRQA